MRGSLLSWMWVLAAALVLGVIASPAPISSTPSSTTNSAGNGSSISTIYYAPLTIMAAGYCVTKTSYSYVTMKPLTGTAFGALTSTLSSITPWSIATVPGAAPTSGVAASGSYYQVDVFLSQAPFSIAMNGEESAWVKACYDPRNNVCPTNDVYGPVQPGVSCITGFPAAAAQTTNAAATVYGPYKSEASRTRWKTEELRRRLFFEVMIATSLIACLMFL